MLSQRLSGVGELGVSRPDLVLVDSINLFFGLHTVGEVLERREYCSGFCWGALQRASHFNKCKDIIALKGYSFVLFFMPPYIFFHISICRVAALDLLILNV